MNFRIRVVLVGVWLVFTLSLTAWWMIYGIQQTELLSEAVSRAGMENLDVFRRQKMLVWEGGILLGSLLLGGAALFYLTHYSQSQSRRLKEFFATFSHDLKTSLTSLRLQAESLQEDLSASESASDSASESQSPLLARLVSDTVRLQVQLENSLFLANEKNRLFIEKLELSRIIDSFRHNWPETEIHLSANAYVMADARAMESILKNLFHNSISHGAASKVEVVLTEREPGLLEILVRDNGTGFSGNVSELGTLFQRHTGTSGSGVGLYLVRQLVAKNQGTVHFESLSEGPGRTVKNDSDQDSGGFHVRIQIPGGLL